MRNLTKKIMAMQFVKLCDSIPLKNITIKEYVEFIGISKQTFYNYFKDKSDLMNYAYEMASQSIIANMDASLQGIYSSAVKMAQVCLSNRQFYLQLSKYETQNSFEKVFNQKVEAVYREKLLEIGFFNVDPSDTKQNYVIHNFCIGICSFFIDWIRSGMEETPEFVAEIIIASMPCDIRAALESGCQQHLKDSC